MNHLNYPMEMRHPNFRPAVVSGYHRGPGGSVSNDPPGQPAVYPPVWVNNRDQELQYASIGYLPANVADAQKYRREVLDADLPDVYRHKAYPKWLYRFNGKLDSTLVQDAEEHARLDDGWHASPDEAKQHFVDLDAAPESSAEAKPQVGDGKEIVSEAPQIKARRGRRPKAT